MLDEYVKLFKRRKMNQLIPDVTIIVFDLLASIEVTNTEEGKAVVR
jgi:hypothetical protein